MVAWQIDGTVPDGKYSSIKNNDNCRGPNNPSIVAG